jgi:hypothetical protein
MVERLNKPNNEKHSSKEESDEQGAATMKNFKTNEELCRRGGLVSALKTMRIDLGATHHLLLLFL